MLKIRYDINNEALERLAFQSDLAAAAANVDLVIESVPESVPIKIEFYEKLAKVAPALRSDRSACSTLSGAWFFEG